MIFFEIEFIDKQSMWLLMGVTVLLSGVVFALCRSLTQRMFFGAFALAFYVYNGFGVVYADGVASSVVNNYITFLSVCAFTYVLAIWLLRAPAKHAGVRMNSYLLKLLHSDYFVYAVLGLYFFSMVFPLIYPEVRLYNLVSPPKADVYTQFQENLEIKMTGKFNPVSKAVESFGTLIFPLYLVCLYRFRKDPFKLFLLIFGPMYLHYCDLSYINRGKVLEGLLLYVVLIWHGVPSYRKGIVVAGLIALPLLPIALVQYAFIRSDKDTIDINSTDAVAVIVYMETQMPTLSEKVYDSNKRINLRNYYIWMTTLPIPKVIIGAVTPVAAAAEMSEIVLGKKRGEPGYFALLAGLLTESVYIYGQKYFWIHAILVGFIIAFAARMVQYAPVLLAVSVTSCIVMSYVLNRAGMGSALPYITNRLLALHLMLIIVYAMHIFYLPYKGTAGKGSTFAQQIQNG